MNKMTVVMIAFLMFVGSNFAFADKPPAKKEVKVHVPCGTHEFPVPAPDEHLTVIVDQCPKKKDTSTAPATSNTVVAQKIITHVVMTDDSLVLRGGLTAGVVFPGRTKPSFLGGLIGEIGHADSTWRLQGTFRAGNCTGSDGAKGVALNSGLAAMNSVGSNFRMGVGADLQYCSNVSSHPVEKADERIVGGSLRLEYQEGHFLLGAQFGGGAATVPTPGSRNTQPVLYGGLSISYLWGK